MIIVGFDKFTTLDYPGKLSALIYTYGCTMKCPFCHNPELVTRKLKELTRYSEVEIIDFMKTRVGLLDALAITGGEPSLHLDLEKFIKKIKDIGFKVKLDTYGLNPIRLKQIIDTGLVDYFAMDVKGNDKTYGACGYGGKTSAEENILESIDLIKNSGSDYEFRTTVLKSRNWHTEEIMQNIGEKIKGAKNYCIQNFRSTKTLSKKYQGTMRFSFNDRELNEMKEMMKGYAVNVVVRN